MRLQTLSLSLKRLNLKVRKLTPNHPNTEAQEKSTKPVFDEAQQEAFDKAIGKKVFQISEKDREIKGLNARIKALEENIPKEQRPVIPPTPDPYQLSDQEFRRKAGERDQAIARQAAYDAQQG